MEDDVLDVARVELGDTREIASWVSLRSTQATGVEQSGCRDMASSLLALMANAWVGEAIEDVHDKVDQDHQAGDQQNAVLHHRVVARAD